MATFYLGCAIRMSEKETRHGQLVPSIRAVQWEQPTIRTRPPGCAAVPIVRAWRRLQCDGSLEHVSGDDDVRTKAPQGLISSEHGMTDGDRNRSEDLRSRGD